MQPIGTELCSAYDPDMSDPSSLGTGWQRQREAAARNEAKLLDAARSLLGTLSAPIEVDMRAVAEAAGVGVGTLYRRFGDKAGLLAAVIGADESELQQAILNGPPPLGPGADADARLQAFLKALIELTERNLGALLVTELTPPGRLAAGAYRGWRLHVVVLLRQTRLDANATDAGWYADALLATVDAQHYAYQRRELRMSQRRVIENARALAAAITRAR